MSAVLTAIAPIWKVLVVGLILGAGLPALFALGMRFLSTGTTVHPDGSVSGRTTPVAMAAAVVCFLIIGLVVIAGIIVLAASKAFLARFGLS